MDRGGDHSGYCSLAAVLCFNSGIDIAPGQPFYAPRGTNKINRLQEIR
jgi:hypothetical protein